MSASNFPTVTDRSVQYPSRVTLTNVSGDVYDVTAAPGTVTAEGTLINAELFESIRDDSVWAIENGGTGATTAAAARAALDVPATSQLTAEQNARIAADADLSDDISDLTDAVAAKYTKPATGIPKTDLTSAVQTSLDAADSALQDAPSDSKTYGRKNGAWSEVTSGSTDFIITVTKEQTGYASDKTNAEIYAAEQADKRIILHMDYEDQWYIASEVTSTLAKFGFIEDDGQNGVNASVVTIENNVVTANLWSMVTDTELTGNYRTAAAQNVIDAGKQDALPTVTNGKYLHANSSTGDLEWDDALKNTATGSYSVTVEGTATTRNGATNVGVGSVADGYRASAYGNNASATAQEAVAIGFNAVASAQGAKQIGAGTNSTANTFQVGSYQMLDSTGKIPDARLNDTVAMDADVVHLTGDETVAGVKTFSSSPIVPTPTTAMQAVNKKYVDKTAAVKYGFELDMSNSNPATNVTYIESNANYSSAAMNYTTNTFDYGDWENAFFMPKPCMLSFDGVVENYLDPNDYTKNEDGTASEVATSTTANAMMEWPVIYVKRTYSDNKYRCIISQYKFDDSYKCLANIDDDGNVMPFYTAIYFGSYDDTQLRSLSGTDNMVSQNAATEISRAQANGNGWYTERIVDRWLINDLLVLIGKGTNTQTIFGKGVSGASAAIISGTMDDKGLFWGSSDATSGVKVFGMENYWGNLWRRQAGWMLVNGVQKIKLTTGTQDGSTATAYNTTGVGYIELANSTPTGTSGGYIDSIYSNGEYGMIPQGASGSSTTYLCDGLWFNNSATIYAFVGGSWSYGVSDGAFSSYLRNGPSVAGTAIGAALSFK